MKRYVALFAGVCAVALLVGLAAHAQEPAKVGGKWEMTSQGRQGPVTREMTIEQTGDKIKGTIKSGGQGPDSNFEGTLKGTKISFTVKRQRPDGSEITIEYTGTVEGDSIKGTVQMGGGGQGGGGGQAPPPREWSAKRQK